MSTQISEHNWSQRLSSQGPEAATAPGPGPRRVGMARCLPARTPLGVREQDSGTDGHGREGSQNHAAGGGGAATFH